MIASGIRAPITGKVWDQYQHGWGGNAGPADTGSDLDFNTDLWRRVAWPPWKARVRNWE
jgi:hypothetical protein